MRSRVTPAIKPKMQKSWGTERLRYAEGLRKMKAFVG